ncbi:AT-hook motif nuclear-localized protein 5-like isoform X2 [Camellia sinensis]|uniref:AT-hook motif nuclear-localized protein 5-like isoform X2 n=1 Tax=Camellia sinensis TaxID=4442 RepID=UPI00103672CD|nr:AT-hook motif nuclear-localized protein 5-like isoform X2 [Camellia sinensis]
MDGRESIALSGSSSYYLHRGFSGSASTHNGLHAPPSFSSPTNPNLSVQSNVRDSSPVGPTFPVENTSPSFPHGLNMGMPMGQPAKKKRGRPRKYGPDGTNMSLGLSPMSAPGSMTPTPKRARGRPPGSGRKQQLASLGEWMNSSAGLAFTPHVINITEGEGQFQILCLSGSFLVADNGGPRSRTGSLSVSLCSSDGYVVGGGVGGMLIAGGPVQVVVCSFAYGGSKSKNKTDVGPNGEQSSVLQPSEEAGPPASPPRRQNLTPISSSDVWPNLRNLQTEIDLTRLW